jgi:ribosomal protein RSM22 (predicted rRNA methylase)
VVLPHNSYMTEARFSAKQWQLHHAEDWATWIESSRTSRIKRMSRLAEGARRLTLRWVASSEHAERVVLELPRTLNRCNELAFSSESETLAYTIWHLVDRYARIIQVLDELVRRGQLPLRKTRLSALEIGAGPSPALHAVRDFYGDLVEWTSQLDDKLKLTPATHLLSLDRGPAWSHLVHGVSEELLLLGDDVEPHLFGINYADFESFSVKAEHREAIARLARWIIADADAWDEYLELSQAQSQAIASHDYPPGAIDLIILCNFLTEAEMTHTFAEELAGLADSLTPGGILLILGSQAANYDAIFDDLSSLITRSGKVRPLFRLDRVAPHPDPRVYEVISNQIVACLQHCKLLAPDAFSVGRVARGNLTPGLPQIRA